MKKNELAEYGINAVKEITDYYENSDVDEIFWHDIAGRIAMLWCLNLIDITTRHKLEKDLFNARIRKHKANKE